MSRAITYSVFLEEPCLVTAPGGDPNTESSLSYLPGSVMRGALASAFIHSGREASDPAFTQLFLKGGARFVNAYPALSERALPVPRSWVRRKDEGDTIYDRTNQAQESEVKSGILKAVGAPFVTTDLEAPEISYEITVHMSRNRDKGRAVDGDPDSALFRYQALARRQQFAGAIVLDEEVGDTEIEELQTLLRDSTLMLGGSHRAGYGLSEVTEVKTIKGWRELGGTPQAIPANEPFIVYLISHAILIDPATGKPTSDIRRFLPGNPDDYGDYTVTQSFAKMTWVGGFNAHWGLPIAQEWAVEMGSVWTVKSRKSLDVDAIESLEHTGIGGRTVEGFGRLAIAPMWPSEPFSLSERSLVIRRPLRVPANPGAQEVELLRQMNERATRQELDRLLMESVNRKANPAEVRGRLSRSQLARLQLRIRDQAGKEDFERFINYLDETEKRKSADDQFRKYSVAGKNFREWLRDLAAAPQRVWGEFDWTGWTQPQIGETVYDFRSELAHDYTVKFISGLCRQLAKGQEDK